MSKERGGPMKGRLYFCCSLKSYAVTGSVAFTLTGVSQPKRSGFRPLAMAKNSSAILLRDLAGLAVGDQDAVDRADRRAPRRRCR